MNKAAAIDKALSTARALAEAVKATRPSHSTLVPLAKDFLVEHDAILNWKRPLAPLPDPDNPRLTAREREAVKLALEGKSGRQIARKLNITAGTVKIHLKNARLKI